MKILTICAYAIFVFPILAFSQQSEENEFKRDSLALSRQLEKLSSRLDSINAVLSENSDRVLEFGISFGWRYAYKTKGELIRASISPVDTTLQLDDGDQVALICSGALVASPFGDCETSNKNSNDSNCPFLTWKRIEFLAALNLVEFVGEDVEALNIKSVEGGIGLGYKLHPQFSLAITFERIFNRRLRDNLLDREGEVLHDRGQVVFNLDKTDDRFFRDDKPNCTT